MRAQVNLMMSSINNLNSKYDSVGEKLDKIGQDIRLHIELHRQREDLMAKAAAEAASKTAAQTAKAQNEGDWSRWDRQLGIMHLSGVVGGVGLVLTVVLWALNLGAHHLGWL